jgi:hypothetical protein
MSLETFIDLASVVSTVAVAIVGFLLNRTWRNSDQRRQDEQHERDARAVVATVLEDLTTGEVEDARNLVGTLRYGSSNEHAPAEQDVTRACYRLTWAIERAGAATLALDENITDVIHDARTHQPQWHLTEIIRNVELLSTALIIDDSEAAARRAEVVRQLEIWGNTERADLTPQVDQKDFQNDLDKLRATLRKVGIRASPVR